MSNLLLANSEKPHRSTAPVTQAPVVLHARVVTGSGGGPDKTILNSPRFLAPYGYEALCAYMRPPGDPGFDELARRAATWGAELIAVDDRGPADFRILKRLLAICRERRVTIWHGHDYKSNLFGLLLRRHWPMRLVTTVHGWVKFTRRTPLYYGIDRFCLRRYERVICVSDDLRESCLKAGAPSYRCLVIDNAIDTQEYSRQYSVEEAKRKLGRRTDRLLLGAVGRLSEEKGFDRLILAAHRLIEQGFDLELVIVGEGDARRKLTCLIEKLGRQDRIHLVGFRADTIAWHQAMDVFVLSSLREGLPNVVLEAMALETPVVATRIAGVPRLVQHQKTGLTIEPDDAQQLTSALAEVLANAELRKTLAAAGRKVIEEQFSFSRRMEKIRAVYDDVLHGPRR
jgi:glycosyltransferase involved in cell wall biosynthesis